MQKQRPNGVAHKGHGQYGQDGENAAPDEHILDGGPPGADGYGVDGGLAGRGHVADAGAKPYQAHYSAYAEDAGRQGLADRQGHSADHSGGHDVGGEVGF